MQKLTLLRQYELLDASDSTLMVCWLEDQDNLKIGTKLTLKGIDDREWIISNKYFTTRTVDELAFSKRWKVGGLV